MNIRFSFLRASAVIFLLNCTSLQAAMTELIFENNTPPPPPPPSAFRLFTVDSSAWWAQSFTVTADYTLTSVVLRMGSSTDTPGGNFLVQIYDAGIDGTPGTTSLGSLIGEGNPFFETDHTFTPDPETPISLNAGTYYVVAGVSDLGSYNWKAEDDSDGPIIIETGSTIGISVSSDSGMTWSGPIESLALDMQVNGVIAVPEPANMALGIFGVLLIGVQSFRWWNARRKQIDPLASR